MRLETRKIDGQTSCAHCQSDNSFVAGIYGKYFHVFWVPIISTGKTVVVECSHCKKTYRAEDLSPENQLVIQKSLYENPPKNRRWLNFGCFAIILFIGFIICAVIYAKIRESSGDYDDDTDYQYEEVDEEYNSDSDSDSNYEYEEANTVIEDPKPAWLKIIDKDIRKSELYPTKENEPISYDLNQCLDPNSINLGAEDVGYFYRIYENKILILIEAWDFNKLTNKEKDAVYSKIDSCLDKILAGKNYERYIGVYNDGDLQMQKSPKGIVKDSTANRSELLKEFYDFRLRSTLNGLSKKE